MVSRLSQTNVMIRQNVDKPEVQALAKAYHVKGIPTTIVISPKGEEIDRIIGYDNRSEWMRTLLAYTYGVDTLGDLLARSSSDQAPGLRRDIAQKYLDRGDAKDALAWVDKARTADKKSDAKLETSLALIRGEALLSTDPPKGVEVLNKLAQGEKSDAADEAFSSLSRYYRGAIKHAADAQAKKQAESDYLSLYHAAMPHRQDDSGFLNDYAWHCAEQGLELDKAAEAARKAVAISHDDPGILDTLAEVYYKMGKKDEAVATIDRALKQKPNDKYLEGQRAKFLKMNGGGTKG